MRPAAAKSPLAEVLVDHHRQFLSFLERRVESRAVAEEILQEAFVKSIRKGDQIRDEESAVAWFYRLLRNAVIDHYRRRGAEARALEAERGETWQATADDETKGVICGCMHDLLTTLKPEQQALLRAVDLDERSIGEVGKALGLTPGNARVRLHRARQALKARLQDVCSTCAVHGCLDCTCEAAPGAASGHGSGPTGC